MNSPKLQYLVSANMDVTRGVTTVTDGHVDFTGYLYNKGGRDLTLEEYIQHPETRDYQEPRLVDEAEFIVIWRDALRKRYTDQAPRQIDEAVYDDMKAVLPPLRMGTHQGMRFFLLSEFTTGSITEMFACYQGLYLRKYVDVQDKATWLTAKHFGHLEALAIP